MYCMLVTLDVSRLSGWLNAFAPFRYPEVPCRVTPRHMEGETGGGRRKGAWGRGVAVHAACTEEPTRHWARHAQGKCAR